MLTLTTTPTTPSLAHEIRNPLLGMMSNLKSMQEITGEIKALTVLHSELDALIIEINSFIATATQILNETKTKVLANIEIQEADGESERNIKEVAVKCVELCKQTNLLWSRLNTHSALLKNHDQSTEILLDGIDCCTDHLLSLISSLFPFGEINTEMNVKPKSVTTVIQKLCYLYSAKAKENGLKINFNPDAEWQEFFLTSDVLLSFRQVLINLVTNSIKFTPPQGSITLNLELNSNTNNIEVSITDTGPGMSEETKTKIRERKQFHQGDNPKSTDAGTGLGLSFSIELIEKKLGGVLTIPDISCGSTIMYTIAPEKFAKESAENLDQKKSSSRPPSPSKIDEAIVTQYPQLKGIKILIAEDNINLHFPLRKLLGKAGIICEFAVDAEEAIAKSRKSKPEIILMDLCMPSRGDGFRAAKLILAEEPNALILAFSADDSPNDKVEARVIGMKGYLTKSTLLPAICEEISRVLLTEMPVACPDSGFGPQGEFIAVIAPEPIAETIAHISHSTPVPIRCLDVLTEPTWGINTWCGFHSNTISAPASPPNSSISPQPAF